MKLETLTMPPLNTTLMGAIKGALDYHGIESNESMAFGISGHAFLINVHKQLCPSGPYVWKTDAMLPLFRNLGIIVKDLGFFSAESTSQERAKVEEKVRQALDVGIPCGMVNLDHQLITGYDDTGFDMAQPWTCVDFPPARLSFGTWQEHGDEIHMSFYSLAKTTPAESRKAVLDSLDYAVDLYKNPDNHNLPNYGIGPKAWENWIGAVEEYSATHGNWWNATVWSECRQMAAQYFSRIAEMFDEVKPLASDLSASYARIGDLLIKISDKEMPGSEKIPMLEECRNTEAAAIKKVGELVKTLHS